ncbi:threonine aldolase family protein [Kitasatospora azatica]|uniref:threonine aldolase family protein n=1 Tax=Kitasatospora azatica TaxID=58347 RepID=UPI0005650DD6|nr:beta-eliminating lyase-related protein [Kitasatospora azatica]
MTDSPAVDPTAGPTLDPAVRRRLALRNSRRILSGERPLTIRERLTALAELDAADELPDFYAEGGAVARLEERVAALLGKEDAVYVPSGTMAQQIALRHGAELTGHDAVALHPMSHLERWERHAYSQLSGLRGLWPTDQPGHFTATELADLGQPFGTMTIELPLRDPGFLLPSWDELVELTAAARAAGARVHFDGARLWDTTPHFGKPLDEIAALADSVYLSLYKTLGSSHGAVLAGDAKLTAYARTWRHRHGGTLWQNWPAALGALAGLDQLLPRIPDYVTHAKLVAEALSTLPGARINPDPPHTHEFQLYLPHPAEALTAANLELAQTEHTWFASGWTDVAPGLAMTEISVRASGLEWTASDVAEAGRRVLGLAAQ